MTDRDRHLVLPPEGTMLHDSIGHMRSAPTEVGPLCDQLWVFPHDPMKLNSSESQITPTDVLQVADLRVQGGPGDRASRGSGGRG